jgi:2',3'-cyclic-nucleotide 2'-phosphodiesterase (5'-nucleotidase family)
MGNHDSRRVLIGPPFAGRLLRFFLFLALATILVGQVRAEPHAPGDRWPTCTGTSAMQRLSFVHVSDIHAKYNPEISGETPVGRIRGYYEAVKKENPYTVFTNGGDDYEKGSVAEELTGGQSTREIVKALGYDVRTLGNHDFAWGLEELLRFGDDPRAVVLSANSRLGGPSGQKSKNDKEPWTDYAELQVGCVKIGFFGLTARPYDATGRQHDGPIYPEIPALVSDYDHLRIARRIIKEHRSEVDLLVLVSHLGITDDTMIAMATDGIDLILGGHSHVALDQAIRVKGTRIIQAGCNAEHIGRLDLHYDLSNRTITESTYRLVDNRPGLTPANAGVDQAVAGILHRCRAEMDETVAVITKDHGRPQIAGIAALAAASLPGVDAAFVNPASVWRDKWRGTLTRQNLLDTFKVEREPVGTAGTSSLYLMRVRGEDLLLARQILRDFMYSGPKEAIAADASYTIAVPKAQATRQESFFGRPISLLPPQPAAELWQTVAAFAGDRRRKGLTLDGEVETALIGKDQRLFVGAEASRVAGEEPRPRL